MKRLDSTIDNRVFSAAGDAGDPGHARDRADRPDRGRSARRRSRRKQGGRSSNSYLGVGRSLGSERDRKRLQDRNAEERSRVERMLAEGPAPRQPMRPAARGVNYQPPGEPASPSAPSAPTNPTNPTTPTKASEASEASEAFETSKPPAPSGPSPSRLRALPTAQGRACPVCASGKVVSDEVVHVGGTSGARGGARGGAKGATLRLSECLHCDHRWTDRTRGRWSEIGLRMVGGKHHRVQQATPGIAGAAVGSFRAAAADR